MILIDTLSIEAIRPRLRTRIVGQHLYLFGDMTQSVLTVGPDRGAKDAAQLMLDHTIGALPVVDGGRLVGIVTETDLLRAFVRSADRSPALHSS
jgi:acetoin utilization protein AcuB